MASVRAVRNGESVLDPGLLRAVVEADAAPARTARPLSRVELDLLRLVADGLTNREIGQRLRWSQATVKKYVQRILEKLDVSDRTRAAVEGVRRGLLG
jgi:DNA-binding NarL/FixJ family response regulator